MIYNPGHTDYIHQRNKEAKPGPSFTMKKCTGPCGLRRSVGQFAPGSNVCFQCAKRSA